MSKPARFKRHEPTAAAVATGHEASMSTNNRRPKEVSKADLSRQPGESSQPSPLSTTDPAATQAAAQETTERAAAVTAPERLVVPHPPPEPDYPRYRVEAGATVGLSDIDPNESER